jgi:hypothetical protein
MSVSSPQESKHLDMSRPFDKPDDVPLWKVENEFQSLQVGKRESAFLSGISEIKTILLSMNERFDGIEDRLGGIESRLADLDDVKEELNAIKQCLEDGAALTKVPDQTAHSEGKGKSEKFILHYDLKLALINMMIKDIASAWLPDVYFDLQMYGKGVGRVVIRLVRCYPF